MKAADSSVLIVAKAALLRDGLEALLSAIPAVDAVHVAEDADHALLLAQTYCPRLILMDAELLGPDLEGFLAGTAVKQPPPDCIVLVDSHAQEVAGLVSGACEVLWTGLPADQLLARVRARLTVPPG